MPELISHAPDNPEFPRVIEMRSLRGIEIFPFDIAPTPAEATALARLLDAQAVRKLRFQGTLAPLPQGGWKLDARLGATVVQTCVVSLEPVTERVDQEVHRRFLPEHGARPTEIVIRPDEGDEVEPLGERIDLGLIAIEALALALPAYPRKPGVSLGPAFAGTDDAGADEDAPKPFAALAALRGKLGHGS